MLASTLGTVGVLALLALLTGIVNPAIPLVALALVGIPLAFMALSGLFRHAAPSADTGSGPAVPSTRDASYEPVADPSDRA